MRISAKVRGSRNKILFSREGNFMTIAAASVYCTKKRQLVSVLSSLSIPLSDRYASSWLWTGGLSCSACLDSSSCSVSWRPETNYFSGRKSLLSLTVRKPSLLLSIPASGVLAEIGGVPGSLE